MKWLKLKNKLKVNKKYFKKKMYKNDKSPELNYYDLSKD